MKIALLVFFLRRILLFILAFSSSVASKFRVISREIEGPEALKFSRFNNSYAMRSLLEYDPYESKYSVSLRGSTDLGYYYATVFVGTPPQKQTVIVDTGSSVTAIPCKQCINCGKSHSDPYYNPEKSETAAPMSCNQTAGNYKCKKCNEEKCQFSVTYTEGSSLYGDYMTDTIVFGDDFDENLVKQSTNNTSHLSEQHNSPKFEAVFGCTSTETGLFYTQEADGILGLGIKSNSTKHPPNLMDYLSSSKEEFGNAFSLCLAEEGGFMTLGGMNSEQNYKDEKINYIPLVQGDQYYVDLTNILVEDMNLAFTKEDLTFPKGVFFDSGTTMTHVPPHIRDRIIRYLGDFCWACPQGCGHHFRDEQCYTRDKIKYPKLSDFYGTFPDIHFQFGNQFYTWRPENYFYKPSSDKEEYCLAMFEHPDRIILGASFMKDHNIYFDKSNRMLGFAEANCRGAPQKEFKRTKPPAECLRVQRYLLETSQFDDLRDLLLSAAAFVGGIVAFYSLLRYRRRLLRASSPQNVPLTRPPSNSRLNLQGADSLARNDAISIAAETGNDVKNSKRTDAHSPTLKNDESTEHPPKGKISRKSIDKTAENSKNVDNGGEFAPKYNYQISEDDDHLDHVDASYEDITNDIHPPGTGQDDSRHVIDARNNDAKSNSNNTNSKP